MCTSPHRWLESDGLLPHDGAVKSAGLTERLFGSSTVRLPRLVRHARGQHLTDYTSSPTRPSCHTGSLVTMNGGGAVAVQTDEGERAATFAARGEPSEAVVIDGRLRDVAWVRWEDGTTAAVTWDRITPAS